MGSPVGPALGRPGPPRDPPDARSSGRVPLAASRLLGGEPERLCARCGPRLLAPSPGRNHAGQKRACRDAGVPCRSLGCCYPWSGDEGARVVRAPERRGTPPGHPAPPRGMVRTPRGAEPSGKSGAGWRWAPGSHPSAPSVPAASGPSRASPSLPFPRPRPRRARRVRVCRSLRRAVWSRLAPPLPGSVPTIGEQR